MHIKNINTDEKVFIIAEIGNNHEGDFTLAQEMVGLAAEAGVDAVKFQTFIPELFVARSDVERLERLRNFQLSFDQFEKLSRQANELGIIFFSTPLDLESAAFLNNIQPIFKIASGDNTFLPLIETVASFNKPTLVSTGLADLVQLNWLLEAWTRCAQGAELALLHCVSSYPVPFDQANLGAIATLQTKYAGQTIGYSDHTVGTDVAALAVAVGARIVEKHFTIDKHYSDFRDHQLSADPKEMANLVDAIRRVEVLLGSGEKLSQPCEDSFQISGRRSIAAKRDLPANYELSLRDLCWVRPGSELVVGQEKRLVGRRTKRVILQGELIRLTDVI